ncbi:hypothetical protein L9F63_021835 [Diploptera punctata]|uniref:CHK kinase-like domain-containing protein n=1 Tax=Diploptera punctata TaxID=6984 RepID=A0AAD7ZPJ2_DIPPU|nr:hypothetical protein L9F63_021835 [Diploptera punctata]
MEKTDTDDISWLNAELFTKILSKEEEITISIKALDVKPAISEGENFLGVLYRVTAEYENPNGIILHKSYIVKTPPSEQTCQNFLIQIKGTEKELLIYKYILPAMNKYMESTKQISPFAAKYFKTDKTDTIILEDLKYLGYKMADRQIGLNLDHCKVTIRKLAQFHALSRKLYETNPELIDKFREGFYARCDENYTTMNKYFETKMADLVSEIKKMANL